MRSPRIGSDARRLLGQEVEGNELREVKLVDADEPAMPETAEQPLLSHEEARELERFCVEDESRRAAEVVSKLTLSGPNLERARQVRAAFEAAGDGGDVGERLLEEFVADEVAIARELSNVEATLVAMLSNLQANPEVGLVVLRTLKETVAMSDAIRRRMQNSLSAAATLRAQRHLIAAQRGRIGV